MDLFGENTPAPEEDNDEPEISADFTAFDPAQSNSDAVFQHPRLMNTCLGHDAVEKRLIELYNTQRMHHGLIFSGPKGIGKATMAYRMARFLLKHGRNTPDPNQNALFADEPPAATPDSFDLPPDDPVVRRVASAGHPDLMTIERAYDAAKNRFKESVAVDDIRKVPAFLRMTASGGGWRIVIIDDADTMNRNAQNALLKILEEPPEQTLIILIAHRLGTLIPTIRSRTQLVPFQPLEPTHLGSLIRKQAPSMTADDMQILAHLSDGSIGKALQIIEEQGIETLSRIMGMLQYQPYWRWTDIHALAEDIARPGQERSYKTFCELLVWLYAQIAKSKARGTQSHIPLLTKAPLLRIAQNSSLEQLLKICENLESHFTKIESANLDKRQGIIGAFSLMAVS